MKKFNYYHVDCGHFPVQIKLCFSNEEFQNVLKDHDITMKATALDEGVAETHYLTDGKLGIIVIAFDLEECGEHPAELAGVIAHEATHCVSRVFHHIGEEPEEIGEESRAYLMEHIVRQLHAGVMQHKEKLEKKNVGKRNRKVSSKESEGEQGSDVQVDIDSDGSAGQDRIPESKDSLRGTEDGERTGF